MSGTRDLVAHPQDLEFGQATDEQLDTVWRLNAHEWAAPLSVEAHIKRERTLSEQELTKGGAWRTWVLTTKNAPKDIVASCETFEKAILISNIEGVHDARGYGIASVFTSPAHRGQGVASRLMDCLKNWLDGEGDGAVSVLYSDIGKVCLQLPHEICRQSLNPMTQICRNSMQNLGGFRTRPINYV
jgi:GNAT superfamily N-acetyltransferase